MGAWLLDAGRRRPGDLNSQIADLLAGLTTDLDVWVDLSRRHQGNLFCGLFLSSANEGEELSAASALAIGQRGLLIGFDIYADGHG